MTDWENGNIKELTAANLLRLCEVLLCDPWWLVDGSGPEPTDGFLPAPSNEYMRIQHQPVTIQDGEVVREGVIGPPILIRKDAGLPQESKIVVVVAADDGMAATISKDDRVAVDTTAQTVVDNNI